MPMIGHSVSPILTLLLIVLVQAGSGAAKDYRLPFPRFLDSPGEDDQFHIVSEKFDSRDGYSAQEDLVDFRLGRGSFVERRANSHRTIYTDAGSQSTYVYKPYTCEGKLFPDLPGTWTSRKQFGDLSIAFASPASTSASDKDGGAKPKPWYLLGPLALWKEALARPSSYTPLYTSYEGQQKRRHKWTVKEEGNFMVQFYFHESVQEKSNSNGSDSNCENCQLKQIVLTTFQPGEGQPPLVTTISIISMLKNSLADSLYQSQHQLPLMYGCGRLKPLDDYRLLTKVAEIEQSIGKYHLKMEVTASRMRDSSSDIMSLEFARTRPPALEGAGGAELWSPSRSPRMRMIHQVNASCDIKIVLDRSLNIKYKLNRRTGTCQMSNLGSLGAQNDDQEEPAKLGVQFSNGLEWDFSDKMMNFLFYDLAGLELARMSRLDRRAGQAEHGAELAHFTGSAFNMLGRNEHIRLVRRYSLWPEDSRIELESASVWVLDANFKLSETYHFNVLESGDLLFAPNEARLFDVSHECYLDQQQRGQMQHGRDFVRLQLHYPVQRTDQQVRLPHLTDGLEREFYHSIRVDANISHFRVPRMELAFDQAAAGGGMTLRLLLLDLPPLHLVYDRADEYVIEPGEGDLVELAPDLRRCSDLCHHYRCEAMSYCRGDFACVIARSQKGLGAKMRSTLDEASCTTYRKPKTFEEAAYYDSTLANVMGRLRRHGDSDWRDKLPKAAAGLEAALELATSSGTPLSAENLRARQEYVKEVKEFLGRVGLKGFSVVKYLWGMMLVLVPDRIEIEPSPLAAPGSINAGRLIGMQLDASQEQNVAMPAFHRGLHRSRYNYKAFEQPEDNSGRREARRFMGILDYDQCALACIDGKCSSFSYCKLRKECIITDIYDIDRANGQNYIQPDADCAIVQRDFLSKFNKFSGVSKPQASGSAKAATNPSECAHGCMVESDFNCLAFTYCSAGRAGACVYSNSRNLDGTIAQSEPREGDSAESQCDHYTRSYLADFTRAEFRQIQPDALSEMATSLVEGQNVDNCAEMCAAELLDCSAFQFCFDPESPQSQQECVMIESPADGAPASVEPKQASQQLSYNQKCHVFTLRKDSSEAQQRQLALADPMIENKGGDAASGQLNGTESAGLELLWRVPVVFVGSSLVFSVLGLAIHWMLRKRASLCVGSGHFRAPYGRY